MLSVSWRVVKILTRNDEMKGFTCRRLAEPYPIETVAIILAPTHSKKGNATFHSLTLFRSAWSAQSAVENFLLTTGTAFQTGQIPLACPHEHLGPDRL